MVIPRFLNAALLSLALAGGPVAAQTAEQAAPASEQPIEVETEAPNAGSRDILVGAAVGVLAGILLLAIIVGSND